MKVTVQSPSVVVFVQVMLNELSFTVPVQSTWLLPEPRSRIFPSQRVSLSVLVFSGIRVSQPTKTESVSCQIPAQAAGRRNSLSSFDL